MGGKEPIVVRGDGQRYGGRRKRSSGYMTVNRHPGCSVLPLLIFPLLIDIAQRLGPALGR
jgi:hypothetical protein